MQYSYQWRRDCLKWRDEHLNPYELLTYEDIEELNNLQDKLVFQVRHRGEIPNAQKIKRTVLEQWANSTKLRVKIAFGCVGDGHIVHKIRCVLITKNRVPVVINANSLCYAERISISESSRHDRLISPISLITANNFRDLKSARNVVKNAEGFFCGKAALSTS